MGNASRIQCRAGFFGHGVHGHTNHQDGMLGNGYFHLRNYLCVVCGNGLAHCRMNTRFIQNGTRHKKAPSNETTAQYSCIRCKPREKISIFKTRKKQIFYF
jgi:hypothetical protein